MHDTASVFVMDIFRHVHDPARAEHPFLLLDDCAMTYGQLEGRMHAVAGLFGTLGIAQGDRIVVCCGDDVVVTTLYLAALRIGVTTALIDPASSPDEALVLVRASRAKALFADEQLGRNREVISTLLQDGKVVTVGPTRQRFDSLLASVQPTSTLPAPLSPSGSAFILFTSGTTSRPKGVEVSLAAVAAHMRTMNIQYGYGQDSIVMNSLPLHHSDGINHGPVNIMASGGTLVRTGAFAVQQLPRIFHRIASGGITHLITVPTVLALMLRAGPEYNDAFRGGAFRFVSSTAGPLDEKLWREFESRFGTMVVNSYGLTETVCEGFYCGPTPETRRIGTIGKPIDIEVKLLTSDGREADVGEMGEMLIRGTCVMKGYFDLPAETDKVLRDGWLYTGDLAIRDADGFYTLTGRKKNVIICGGINVYPEDVTRTIEHLPGVREATTIGVSDEAWGERVVSCVVSEPEAALTSDAVIDYCRAHLSPEKVPSRVLMLDLLPRGPSGKIALPDVKRIVAQRLNLLSDAEAAADVNTRVFQIAARCFKIGAETLDELSDADNTPGWNSLAHMDFLVGLESAFGFVMQPGDMLDIITLGDAVAYVKRRVAA